MTLKHLTALLAALALVGVASLGTATTITRTQKATGNVFVGNPASGLTGGLAESFGPGSDFEGFDGVWIALAQSATGTEPVTLDYDTSLVNDLDIYFYDADFNLLEGYDCVTLLDTGESCTAPAGAVWAIVDGATGVDVDFTFTYTYQEEVLDG